ncbi:MAG TPA: hypothetical protein VGP20_03530 [Steroidobacteraceae bacterium]|jgi:hypothetical protein|nr:hypothetical protein [Steroidobacteraceae bacterium]
MKTFHRVALAAVVLAVSGLSGCIVARDHGPYSYERGDRIDRYGHREVAWCDNHHEDEHCR